MDKNAFLEFMSWQNRGLIFSIQNTKFLVQNRGPILANRHQSNFMISKLTKLFLLNFNMIILLLNMTTTTTTFYHLQCMHISTFNFTYQTSNMQQLHGIHQFQHRTQEHNTHILKSWNYHHNIKDFQISIYPWS